MRTHLALAAIALLATGAHAMPPSPTDLSALEALAAANDLAWNAADATAISRQYTTDSSLRLSPMDSALIGREAVRTYFARVFGQRPPGMRHISRLERVEMIAPDLAFADVHVRVEQREGDGWALAREFVNHSVLRRENGIWHLHAVRAHRLSR